MVENQEPITGLLFTLPTYTIRPGYSDIGPLRTAQTKMQIRRILAIEVGIGHAETGLRLLAEFTTDIKPSAETAPAEPVSSDTE